MLIAGEHRHRVGGPARAQGLGVRPLDLALHGVELLGEAEGRQRPGRVRGLGVEEIAGGRAFGRRSTFAVSPPPSDAPQPRETGADEEKRGGFGYGRKDPADLPAWE